MKTLTSSLLATTTVVLVLGGWAYPSTTLRNPALRRAKSITITYWNTWGSAASNNAQKHLIAIFEKTHPGIKVNLLGGTTPTKDLAAMASGSPPDVIQTWANYEIPSWAAKGAILPLSSMIQHARLNLSEFSPTALHVFKNHGKVYALPYTEDVAMLYYNKADFAASGIKQPPKTIGQMLQDAKKLTIVKNGKIVRLGFDPLYPYPYQRLWNYVFGGRFYNPATHKFTFTSPANVAALKFLVSYEHTYGLVRLTKAVAGFGNYSSATNPFFSGKLAMYVDGEWVTSWIRQYAPHLNYGVAPIPYPNGHPALKDSGWVSPGAIFIPRNAAHPQAAFELIQFLTSPKWQGWFTGIRGKIPTTPASLKNPLFANNPKLLNFVRYSTSPHLYNWPSLTVLPQLATIWGKYEGLALDFKISPGKALAATQAKIQQASRIP